MPAITNGGKTYTIKLKPGVTFSRPSTARSPPTDFKYSFERMMRLPDAPGTYFYTGVVGATDYQAGKAAHVAGYKVLDKYTIQIDLEQPNLAFLNALTVEFCDVMPQVSGSRSGAASSSGRHPLGTGPFMFQKWTSGQEIVLTRNPNYRDAAHVWLDGIKFELVGQRAVGLAQAADRRRRRARQQHAAGQRVPGHRAARSGSRTSTASR